MNKETEQLGEMVCKMEELTRRKQQKSKWEEGVRSYHTSPSHVACNYFKSLFFVRNLVVCCGELASGGTCMYGLAVLAKVKLKNACRSTSGLYTER